MNECGKEEKFSYPDDYVNINIPNPKKMTQADRSKKENLCMGTSSSQGDFSPEMCRQN